MLEFSDPFPSAPQGAAGRLTGKVALVTGASGGIGGAVARLLGWAGAAVVLSDRRPCPGEALAQAIARQGGRSLFVPADVTESAAVRALIARAEEHFGGLHVLVHCAGISGRPLGDGPVTECPEPVWEQVLRVNLTGAYLVSRHALPAILRSGGGSVIHIASDDALAIPPPPHDTHAYIASKGGLVALTRAMAISYAPRVRVNAIAPGWVASPMTGDLVSQPQVAAALVARHPLARLGTPADIAWAALFLASDEAAFITGAVLPVEGGATVW